MRAAVYHAIKDVRLEDVAVPAAKPGKVKINVKVAGICGSDLHAYHHGIGVQTGAPHPLSGAMAPLTLGHEFSGVVAEVGEGVVGIQPGDRVAIEPIMYCGKCASCRTGLYNQCEKMGFVGLNDDGGFAEYVLVEPYMVHKLPDSVSFEEGALVEPTAVAMHAVRQSKLKVGDSAAVFGVGPIGLLTILGAKSAGASKVYAIDVSDERLALAEKLGAIPINSLRQNAAEVIVAAGGVHVAYEAAGVQAAIASALTAVKRGGEVMVIAAFAQPAQLNMLELMAKEASIASILAYRHIFPEIIALIADGKLDVKRVITKQIDLEQIVEDGLELLVKDKSQAKILVRIP